MRLALGAKLCASLLAVMFLCAPAADAAGGVAEKRQAIRKMADETLNRLYQVHPGARGAVESSAGYAVFSSYGVKILFIGGGRGKGLAVNRQTGEEVFMKMGEFEAGLGLGVKEYRVVFVFETDKAYRRFVDKGWEFGGRVTAAATDGVSGGAYQGAVSIWPGAWMYQLTDKGLALELTGKGTRYYKDSELN